MGETGQKVYIGNCEGVPEQDLRDEFAKYGPLENVWIARNPPGFAFVWYRDDRDAQDAVSAMDGKDLCGQMLRVEMSRNRGRRDDGGYSGGYGSRAPPRKTGFKIRISGLPGGTHWTELKDFVRRAGEVIYANVEGDEGVAEFPDRDTMNRAAKELDDAEFGDKRIRVDIQDESESHANSRDGGGYGDQGGYNDRRSDDRGRDDRYDNDHRRRDDRRRDYGGGGGGYGDRRNDYDRRDDRGGGGYRDDRGCDRGGRDRRGRSRSPRGRY